MPLRFRRPRRGHQWHAWEENYDGWSGSGFGLSRPGLQGAIRFDRARRWRVHAARVARPRTRRRLPWRTPRASPPRPRPATAPVQPARRPQLRGRGRAESGSPIAYITAWWRSIVERPITRWFAGASEAFPPARPPGLGSRVSGVRAEHLPVISGRADAAAPDAGGAVRRRL